MINLNVPSHGNDFGDIIGTSDISEVKEFNEHMLIKFSDGHVMVGKFLNIMQVENIFFLRLQIETMH